MTYHVVKPYRPGWAIPQYIKDEGLKRHAFTTMPSPQGTYDNPSVEDAAYSSGYVIPGYILKDGYGGGASVTKWAKRGTYFGPKIPSFLDQPANKVVAIQPSPSGGTAITVQALSGLGDDSAALPDDFHAYGQQAASLILKGVRTQPMGKRHAMLKTVLDRVDPTLYNRTSKIAKGLTKRGVAPAAALHAGLAQAMGTGILKEVVKTGQSGQAPAAKGQLGLGCYGICGSGSALGGSVDLRAGKRKRSTGLRGLLGLGITTAAQGSEVSLVPAVTQTTGTQTSGPAAPSAQIMMTIGPFLVPATQQAVCVLGPWQDDSGNPIPGSGGTNRWPCSVDPPPYSAIPSPYPLYHAAQITDVEPIGTGCPGICVPYLTDYASQFPAQLGKPGSGDLGNGQWVGRPTTIDMLRVIGPFNSDGALFSGLVHESACDAPALSPSATLGNYRANTTYTDPAQLEPGAAAVIADALTSANPGHGVGNHWFFATSDNMGGDWSDGQRDDYRRWVTGLGIQPNQNYFMPMLDAENGGFRQQPFAKFTHSGWLASNAYCGTVAGSSMDFSQGWGLYLFLEFKVPWEPWATNNPYVLRLYVCSVTSVPSSCWAWAYGIIKELASDIVQAAEDILDVVGEAACLLVSAPGAAAGAQKAAGPAGAIGVGAAKLACGSPAPPPVQTGIDTPTLLLIAGGALAVVLAISATKKHNRKTGGT